jgi:hypothetical protein
VDTGRGAATLLPYYYRPQYLAAPTALLIALSGGLLWIRRRERRQAAGAASEDTSDIAAYLKLMDDASAARDAELFFKSARAALQVSLARRWHCAPNSITHDSVAARLGGKNGVSLVFEMADESAYSGIRLSTINFAQWKPLIQRYISGEAFT